MSNSIRELIILDFMARVAVITVANGYNTGIGAHVLRARKKIDADELPAIVVFPGIEKAEHAYGETRCKMTMRVEGIAEFGSTDPQIMSEKILADLKKCILQPYNALTSPVTGWSRSPDYIDSIVYTEGGNEDPPEDGQTTAGAFISLEVGYTTKLNDPYSQ